MLGEAFPLQAKKLESLTSSKQFLKVFIYHNSDRYIDPYCHNFENCLSKLLEPPAQAAVRDKTWKEKIFLNCGGKDQCIYL